VRHHFGMTTKSTKPQAGGVLYTGPSLGSSLAGFALALLRG
jgi:hypothetical protein